MGIESITGRTLPPITNSPSQKAGVDEGNKTSAKPAEKTDSVAITATAKGIKKAFESSSSEAIVDVDRVAAVKTALAEGSYQINPERIAEKMIQHEKLLSETK